MEGRIATSACRSFCSTRTAGLPLDHPCALPWGALLAGSMHPASHAPTASPASLPRSARTENDNGPGAESSPSNAVSVGRPKAPTVSATGSSTGVEVTFTPDTLLTGDVFRYWAVDASAGSNSEPRLTEAAVSSWTTGSGGWMGMMNRRGADPAPRSRGFLPQWLATLLNGSRQDS